MYDKRNNRRRSVRYRTDQFVPAVLSVPDAHQPLGGHIVDVSVGGARMVAAPNLTPVPAAGTKVELVFARSDGNRELDLDGVRVSCRVIDVREPAGARVIRLQFVGEAPRRVGLWVAQLALSGSTTYDDSLPEFDPEVWAGWAAISPGGTGPG